MKELVELMLSTCNYSITKLKNGIYFPEKNSIVIIKKGYGYVEGDNSILELLQPNDIIGLIDESVVMPINFPCKSKENEIYIIKRFDLINHYNIEILSLISKYLQKKLMIGQTIANLRTLNAEEYIEEMFQQIFKKFFTIKDELNYKLVDFNGVIIAQYLGLTYETYIRSISKLKI